MRAPSPFVSRKQTKKIHETSVLGMGFPVLPAGARHMSACV